MMVLTTVTLIFDGCGDCETTAQIQFLKGDHDIHCTITNSQHG
ncbi:hypothetical protein ACHAXS_008945, partial [Conticribra weissflogii]